MVNHRQRKAILIGATGLVGQTLLAQLAKDYAKITVIARRQPSVTAPNIDVQVCKDFTGLKDLLATLTLDAATDAFSCLGTTRKAAGSAKRFRQIDYGYNLAFAEACRAQGVERFFLLSAMNANANSPLLYPRVKGELEQAVQALGFTQVVIFRPSLLLGQHDDRPLEALAQTVFGKIKPFLPQSLEQTRLRPIEAERVAQAMAQTANAMPVCSSHRTVPHTHIVDNAHMLAMTVQ